MLLKGGMPGQPLRTLPAREGGPHERTERILCLLASIQRSLLHALGPILMSIQGCGEG